MIKKILNGGLIAQTILICSIGIAQNNLKIKEDSVYYSFHDYFQNDSSYIYIIGESHIEENVHHKKEIILELCNLKGITKIGIEAPKCLELYYNNYLSKNDSTILNLLKFGDKPQFKQAIKLLREIKYLNNSRPKSSQFTIFCIDVPYPIRLEPTLKCLNPIYDTIENIKSIYFGTILDYSKRKIKRKEAIDIIETLNLDLNKNYDNYKDILGINFNYFISILNGLNISFNNSFYLDSTIISNRERYIYENVIKEIDTNVGCVIFCGNQHSNKKEKDLYYSSFPFTSFTSNLKRMYDGKICSITTQYYKKTKKFGEHHELNLLDNEMKSYFKFHNDICVIPKEVLKNQKNAYQRCDAIIIKNQYYK